MKIIYEKDAIDALHRTMLGFFKTNDDDKPEFITASEKMLLSVNKAISKALKALPSAQPEQRWIPCSERLPQPNEKDADGFIKAYLVQDGRWMDVARWNGDCWIAWGYGTALTNVTAWMPLPEPYAERRTDAAD